MPDILMVGTVLFQGCWVEGKFTSGKVKVAGMEHINILVWVVGNPVFDQLNGIAIVALLRSLLVS